MGRLLSVVAAVCIGIGAILPWSGIVGGSELLPLDLRSQWAFGLGGDRTTDVWLESVLFVLAVAAVLVLVGAVTGSSGVGLVGALVAAAAVIAWVVQVADLAAGVDSTLWERLGQGVALVGLGVLLALISTLFMRNPSKQPALAN
jgi:hypothetical protein